MRRITVSKVKSAYQKVGLKPARRTFRTYTPNGKVCGACAIAALAAANGGVRLSTASVGEIVRWADQEYGEKYSISFREAFDGFDKSCIHSKQGYADGRAAAIAIFGEVQA